MKGPLKPEPLLFLICDVAQLSPADRWQSGPQAHAPCSDGACLVLIRFTHLPPTAWYNILATRPLENCGFGAWSPTRVSGSHDDRLSVGVVAE